MSISRNKSNKSRHQDSNLDEINIIVTGDFCPHLRIEELCLAENYDKIYNDVLPILKKKDLSITNLECPLTTNINPILKSGPHLVAHPKCIEAIKFANFDVVTLANNHILDQDEAGLKDTLKLCKDKGVKTVGAGINLEEASHPLYLNIKNKKIAILNFAEHEFSIAEKDKAGANPLSVVVNYNQIIEAKKNADIVLIIIHGGHESYYLPSPRMIETYRFFAQLGVAAIINSHTHCPSGYEIYKDVPIFYSLGNFIFDWENVKSKSWFEGYFINLKIANNMINKINLFPYFQCRNKPGIQLMKKEEEAFLIKINNYSRIIKDSKLLETKWKEFCKSKEISYITKLFHYKRIKRKLLKGNIFKNFIIRNDKIPNLLNLIRCEAHRDVLIEILNKAKK